MARELTLSPRKTYASHANALTAVEKLYGENSNLRFLIINNGKGRFYPLFLGEEALQHQVHIHFCVAA